MKTISSLAAAKSIRKTWGFRATTRVHGDGKQTKGFNRAKENRKWKTD